MCCEPDFEQNAAVTNGFSDLIVELWGEAGRQHGRHQGLPGHGSAVDARVYAEQVPGGIRARGARGPERRPDAASLGARAGAGDRGEVAGPPRSERHRGAACTRGEKRRGAELLTFVFGCPGFPPFYFITARPELDRLEAELAPEELATAREAAQAADFEAAVTTTEQALARGSPALPA